MTEPHIRRLSLIGYAALAVSRVIYFGDSEADAASMPALIEVRDLPTLLVFAIRDIKTHGDAASELKAPATAKTLETLKKRIDALIENGILPAYDPHVFLRIEPNRLSADRDDCLVRLDDVSAWLKTQGVQVPYSLSSIKTANPDACDAVESDHDGIGAVSRHGRWPWGEHHTELLGHLEAAARRYWGENYIPADATTAPINATVSEWLQTERKVSRTMADSIASILRPDGLPTGPRK